MRASEDGFRIRTQGFLAVWSRKICRCGGAEGSPEFAHILCRKRDKGITPPALLLTSLVALGLSLSICETGHKTYLAEGRKGSSLPS